MTNIAGVPDIDPKTINRLQVLWDAHYQLDAASFDFLADTVLTTFQDILTEVMHSPLNAKVVLRTLERQPGMRVRRAIQLFETGS